MTRRDNDHIDAVFSASSRDLTPGAARRAARALYMPVSGDSGFSSLCASVLSESELERANRFAAEEDRTEFEQRRAFRRFCGAIALGSPQLLSDIVFEKTENGRPFLSDAPDIWFSFSSCRFGMLGAWSSTHAVGVDIEDHTKEIEVVELAEQYFSAIEARVVAGMNGGERQWTFYRLWTLKEAALKSIGEGLPFGLDAFEFELEPGIRMVHAPPDHGGAERFEAYVIEGTDGCAALVSRSLD
jgi:4'-phosphopantetheinyl transferase